jgi:hypothetical protein
VKLSSWARDTRERTVSTFCGAVLTAWAVTWNWHLIVSFAGLITLYTFLKCVAARRIKRRGTASMTNVVEYADDPTAG